MNNMITMVLAVYKTFGREPAKRMLTPPRKAIEAVCAKTGADVTKALEERDEWVQAGMEFIESLADADFEDPD